MSNLEAFKEFAADAGFTIFNTFEGQGFIEPIKGGGAAVYFPDDDIGGIIPKLGDPIYYGKDREAAKVLVKNALDRANEASKPKTPTMTLDIEQAADKDEEELTYPYDLTTTYIEHPIGIAGDICDDLNQTAHRQMPRIYPMVALQTLALVAGERKGHHGGKLNLFTLAIAPSASGKEHGQGWFAQIASDLKLGRHVVGGIASDVDMIRNLVDGNGQCCYRIDEIQALFNAIKNKNANTYENKIGDIILTFITAKMFLFTGNHRRQFLEQINKDIASAEKRLNTLKELPSDNAHGEFEEIDRDRRELIEKREYIENGWPDPMVSIMGHSTPEELDSIVSAKNVNSGLIGRCLLMRCAEERAPLNQFRSDDKRKYDAIKHRLDKIKRDSRAIGITDEAKEMLKNISGYYDSDEKRNHPILGAIYSRAFELVNKISNLLALETATIEKDHVLYAAKIVNRNIEDIGFLMRKADAQSDDANMSEIISHTKDLIIRKIGKQGVPPSTLRQSVTRSYAKLKKAPAPDGAKSLYDYIIDQMVTAGVVAYVEENKKRRYVLTDRKNL